LRIAVVTPVFNDWASLECLVAEIDRIMTANSLTISLFAVNDGSTAILPDVLQTSSVRRSVEMLEVLNLVCNVGHQRAIALGLAEVSNRADVDVVIVMDADGEDCPEEIPKLIELHRAAPDAIIVGQRTKRSEGLVFTTFYELYKWIFRILTGRKIDFGNFSLIPNAVLKKLVNTPETWNHLAAAYVRSRLEILRVPTLRGKRYVGKSHMNLASLVLHGIGAMAVFSDILFARLLVACAGLAGLSILGICAAIGIRVFTTLAIPGWATIVVGTLSVFFVQLLILMMASAFILLSTRSFISVTPAGQLQHFIESRRVIPSAHT
jgi:polyisoprenyl-phosphate glycosyltransferase